MKDQELEWLANHLGHSIDVHRNFYRLPENTIQLAKVGKYLMALESEGGAVKYKGKSLEDITEVSDIEEEEEDGDGISEPGWFFNTFLCHKWIS